jgi:hypothetical protein
MAKPLPIAAIAFNKGVLAVTGRDSKIEICIA